MSRRKRGSRRFVQIDESVYRTEAWRTLPNSALRLWIDLRVMHNGHNNGRLTPTFAALRPLGWNSKEKLARALALLIEYGFVRYTRKAGPNAFHRAALVRFTDLACPGDEDRGIDGCGPTREFDKWRAPVPGKPNIAVPENRGGTAPDSGEQPPLIPGNGGAEPPLIPGNAKEAVSHRGNGDPNDAALRSPDSGEDIDVAIPSAPPEATPETQDAAEASRSLAECDAEVGPDADEKPPGGWILRDLNPRGGAR